MTRADGASQAGRADQGQSDDDAEELIELLPGGGRLDESEEDRPNTGARLP